MILRLLTILFSVVLFCSCEQSHKQIQLQQKTGVNFPDGIWYIREKWDNGQPKIGYIFLNQNDKIIVRREWNKTGFKKEEIGINPITGNQEEWEWYPNGFRKSMIIHAPETTIKKSWTADGKVLFENIVSNSFSTKLMNQNRAFITTQSFDEFQINDIFASNETSNFLDNLSYCFSSTSYIYNKELEYSIYEKEVLNMADWKPGNDLPLSMQKAVSLAKKEVLKYINQKQYEQWGLKEISLKNIGLEFDLSNKWIYIIKYEYPVSLKALAERHEYIEFNHISVPVFFNGKIAKSSLKERKKVFEDDF